LANKKPSIWESTEVKAHVLALGPLLKAATEKLHKQDSHTKPQCRCTDCQAIYDKVDGWYVRMFDLLTYEE
jgi:hypothetical protein